MSEGKSKTERRAAVVVPDPLHRESDLTRLDDLIGEIEESSDDGLNKDRDLLVEHLRSARQHLFGAMPLEYAVDLENAALAAEVIVDENLRQRVMKTIRNLLDKVPGLATRPT
jgi:hypothetical protein